MGHKIENEPKRPRGAKTYKGEIIRDPTLTPGTPGTRPDAGVEHECVLREDWPHCKNLEIDKI